MSKYVYTEAMREISGMGGGYEQACRAMVVAGLEWCDQHPDAVLEFSVMRNVYGFIKEETNDSEELVEAMVAACPGGPTGAMVQATVGHVLNIRKLGWDAYVKEMTA